MLDFGKVIVPVITPAYQRDVDEESLEVVIQFLETYADSFFVLGTTGEFQHLSFDQKTRVVETAKRTTEKPILVGVSANDADSVLDLVSLAVDYDAEGVVYSPHFGNVQNPIVLIEQFALPTLLYNNPSIQDGESLSLDDIARARVMNNVRGLKDSSGNFEYFLSLFRFRSETFKIYQGIESLGLMSMLMGADGLVPAMSHFMPYKIRELAEKSQKAGEIVGEFEHETGYSKGDYIAMIKKDLHKRRLIASPEKFPVR